MDTKEQSVATSADSKDREGTVSASPSDQSSPESGKETRSTPIWRSAGSLAALFAFVYGARLWLVDVLGSPIPFWDQWDAEGYNLYRQFLLGRLTWPQLFTPWMEHRIVLTRLLTFGLLRLNGMWDPRLEMTVNAAIASGTAVLIAYLFIRELGEVWRLPVVSAVGFLWIIPFGWENTLWGFQSQVYFLVLFSFTAIWGLSLGSTCSARWWLGLVSLALSCMSMASGLLAGLAVVAARCMAIALDRRTWRLHLPTLLVCLVGTGIALLFAHRAPVNAPYQAQGLRYFFSYLFKCLSWPSYRWPFAFLVFAAPLLVSAWTLVKDKGQPPVKWLLLALAIWAVLQAAALAYGRAGRGNGMTSRYQDVLVIGFLASFIALLLEWPRINRWLRYAWIVLAVVGIAQDVSHDVRKTFPELHREHAEQGRRCLAYIQSRDPEVLRNTSEPTDIPYPDASTLTVFLDDTRIRSILLFVPGQESEGGWPGRTSNCLLRSSRAIFALGFLGLLVTLWPRRGVS